MFNYCSKKYKRSESWLHLLANSALRDLDCSPLLVLHFGISMQALQGILYFFLYTDFLFPFQLFSAAS